MPAQQEQKRIRRIGWIVCALLVGMINMASGAAITWVGNVSSNWDDPLNWDLNAVPGTNDDTYVLTSAANICVIPANTTQSVWTISIRGTSATTYGKLILQPGAVLSGRRTSEGPLYFGCGTSARGYFEIQSNATFNTINDANYMALGGWGIPCQMTVAVNGGRFLVPGNCSMGGANCNLAAVYTGAVYVSAGGLVSCANMRLGYGQGWYANEVGRGVLTISDEGSRFQCSADFNSGWGAGSGATEGIGRGTVTIYGGTLSVGGIYYNARAQAGCTNGTNTAECIIRGGQLLVTSHLYNSYAETNNELGTITIASGATNLLIGGDYYQRTNGTLVAEITTSTSHPPLKVNGIAYLAGTLRVASNSVENYGRWDIIIGDADSSSGTPGISGRFNTFDASATGHPANWRLVYTDDKVTLSYVHEGTFISIY